MAQSDQFILSEDIDPIDIVETVATHHEWDFDRVRDDQISMAVDGLWRSYSITLAWSCSEQMLRLVCTFDMDPPEARLPQLYEAINLANDECWDGGFTFWPAQKLMVWRYGLVLTGDAVPLPEQISQMIRSAVTSAERFYPSFQLVCWSESAPSEALDIALGGAYGRA
ncbi:MAG: YbjN domain-containing protein [Paracoccus sp. (in: a-proteobacteria)]|nr:YbjN domain-containing protein [Paracoccus sp. (in: a-proteobacteria)]